jgi:hypothetical protein
MNKKSLRHGCVDVTRLNPDVSSISLFTSSERKAFIRFSCSMAVGRSGAYSKGNISAMLANGEVGRSGAYLKGNISAMLGNGETKFVSSY